MDVAKRWKAASAEWLHIINLDGALDSQTAVWSHLEAIADLGISVQFGGGIRSAESVAQAFNSGAERVILGTIAAENPKFVRDMLDKHGAEYIVVALDARNGKVATHGWQTESEWTATDLGKAMQEMGVIHALYTDILRDGELQGVNINATRQLAEDTGLKVIASGGVSSLDEILVLMDGNIGGVILGKALYEGLINLEEVLEAVNSSSG